MAQVKGAIYSDSGGRPSARLYATTEVHSRTGRSWVEMPFAQNDDGGVFLSGGFYWLSFQLKQDAQCYGASADAGGGSELYMSNEDGYGLGSPSDPFDPFQEVGTEDGTISIYANYESAGIETKKMEAGKCTAVETCEECLRATDSEDHSACVFVIVDEHFPAGSTSRSPCQSQQTVEAAGLSPDHTCQETWGLSLYTELADMECGGTPVAGPGGEMATDVANEEQCAENCHLANSHFLPYTAEGLHADPRESKYCEAYEYDANLRRCTLLSLIEPEAEAGGSCHVSAELGDVCALPIGVWVRSSLGKIYYVSGAQGQLRAAPQELTCFGERWWCGQAAPELWCDGTADSACDVCINAPIAHSKLLGEMSCEDLQVKVARVCQFETADVECDKGEVIRLLEGSYGRFTDAYCVSPTVESLTTGDVCGEVDNEHSAIANLCDGKSVCTIDATDERFSDQNCPGTYKYAQVRYSCVPSGPGRHTPRHATDHWGVDPLGGQ